MAHTDRQPTDEIFNDIKQAAEHVWYTSDFHESYIEEKVNEKADVTNYADNWCTFVQQFDHRNQVFFFDALKLKASVDFLVEQHTHYSYFLPRIKQ